MNNTEIRNKIKNARLFQYEVARALHISEATLIRWLRQELPEKEKARILAVIEQLKNHS
ncbi:hypothetical protein [Pelotomaculum sp. PtaB.Bin117]|uniref:hypothetical protein n=1 Tax=Pelotomaculum sp. PtaB.Bin117 TaxID=1811694 RepID=UPI0009D636FF|nr:hypothetical protein [Pelotomaculum sp. PtaB.Bin117]OPX85730.1 MAG: hypothetical protein A4E54_02268 [Pelotomaculum sp. PtaB.Bin117]